MPPSAVEKAMEVGVRSPRRHSHTHAAQSQSHSMLQVEFGRRSSSSGDDDDDHSHSGSHSGSHGLSVLEELRRQMREEMEESDLQREHQTKPAAVSPSGREDTAQQQQPQPQPKQQHRSSAIRRSSLRGSFISRLQNSFNDEVSVSSSSSNPTGGSGSGSGASSIMGSISRRRRSIAHPPRRSSAVAKKRDSYSSAGGGSDAIRRSSITEVDSNFEDSIRLDDGNDEGLFNGRFFGLQSFADELDAGHGQGQHEGKAAPSGSSGFGLDEYSDPRSASARGGGEAAPRDLQEPEDQDDPNPDDGEEENSFAFHHHESFRHDDRFREVDGMIVLTSMMDENGCGGTGNRRRRTSLGENVLREVIGGLTEELTEEL